MWWEQNGGAEILQLMEGPRACAVLRALFLVCEVLGDGASGLGCGHKGLGGLGTLSLALQYSSHTYPPRPVHPHTTACAHTHHRAPTPPNTPTPQRSHIHTNLHPHHGVSTHSPWCTHTVVFLKSSCHLSLLCGSQTQAACLLPDWFVDLN